MELFELIAKVKMDSSGATDGDRLYDLANMLQAHPQAKDNAEAQHIITDLKFKGAFLGGNQIQRAFNDRSFYESQEAGKAENLNDPYWKEKRSNAMAQDNDDFIKSFNDQNAIRSLQERNLDRS